MTIKNKDGKPYKLQSPNPIMRQQDFWDDGSKFILHNFNDEVVVLNFEQPKPKKYKSIEEIQPQEIEVQIKETPITPEHKVKKNNKNIIIFYCMPAATQESFDPLYNENRVSILYGPQFSFQGIITKSTDLILEVWTNVNKVTKNSILYMPNTRRWWNVENVIKQKEEFTLECLPSSIQPSFAT